MSIPSWLGGKSRNLRNMVSLGRTGREKGIEMRKNGRILDTCMCVPMCECMCVPVCECMCVPVWGAVRRLQGRGVRRHETNRQMMIDMD